jgi:hypothetical protein
VRVVVLALALTALGGCRLGPDDGSAADVATRFHAMVEQGVGDGACAVLAPETKAQLESSQGEPCAQAITKVALGTGTEVLSSDAYGTNARIVLDGDVVFLAAFEKRWLVVSAGCRPRPDRSYDCALEGG